MDACDEVMEKVNRPKKLIRYDSFNGITKGRKKVITPRVIAYSAVLLILLGLEVFLLSSRSDIEALLLRTPGMLYQEVDEDNLSNLYNYQLINKTSKDIPIEFRLITPIENGQIKLIGQAPVANKNGLSEGALFIELPKASLEGGKNIIEVGVYSNGELIEEIKTNFLGPIK